MFDKTVCLTLDKRVKEGAVERIQEEFRPHNIDVKFFLAGNGALYHEKSYSRIDTEPPPNRKGYGPWRLRPNSWNAFQCFRQIITEAQQEGVETLLILEDDVTLTKDFGEVLPVAYSQLIYHDKKWDMFYLGANHTFAPTKQVDTHLLALNGSGCWHAVCLRQSIFQPILDLQAVAPIDEMCGKFIHPRYACYAVNPSIAIPKPGYSYCEGAEMDYTHYFRR